MKRVILHIGYHKTGSSALQAFLAQNAHHLEAGGVHYPYPDPTRVVEIGTCSGNVIQMLFRGGFLPPDRKGSPAGYINDGFFAEMRRVVDQSPLDTVLFSGEVLGKLSQTQIAALAQALAGHRVEILAFVRDPFDFAWSGWKQVSKHSNRKRDFMTFLRRMSGEDGQSTMSMGYSFRNYAAAFQTFHVLRFERHRDNVARAFVDKVGLAACFPPEVIRVDREHNRSLTQSEVELACLVSERFRDQGLAARVVAEFLSRPVAASDPFYSRAAHEVVLRQFAQAIPAINAHLPAEDALSDQLRDMPDTVTPLRHEDVAIVLEVMAKSAQAAAKQPAKPFWLARVLRSLLGAAPGQRPEGLRDPSKSLPASFDRQAYLHFNRDVSPEGDEPERHFLNYGWAEGRRYSYGPTDNRHLSD